MKKFHILGVTLCVILVAGCGNQDNREAPPKTAATNAGMNDTAKASARQGMDNATIEQNIRKNRRLPNGQPLPTGPGQVPSSTPGASGG